MHWSVGHKAEQLKLRNSKPVLNAGCGRQPHPQVVDGLFSLVANARRVGCYEVNAGTQNKKQEKAGPQGKQKVVSINVRSHSTSEQRDYGAGSGKQADGTVAIGRVF